MKTEFLNYFRHVKNKTLSRARLCVDTLDLYGNIDAFHYSIKKHSPGLFKSTMVYGIIDIVKYSNFYQFMG